MTLARYFVFRQDQSWIVGFEGRVMAHFLDKDAALDSAKGMANLMGAMHYDADVMLDEGGPLQQIWVHGRDAIAAPHARRHRRSRMQLEALPHHKSLVVITTAA